MAALRVSDVLLMFFAFWILLHKDRLAAERILPGVIHQAGISRGSRGEDLYLLGAICSFSRVKVLSCRMSSAVQPGWAAIR